MISITILLAGLASAMAVNFDAFGSKDAAAARWEVVKQSAVQGDGVKVNIPGLGALEGFTSRDNHTNVFWGVPFAAPPVNDLRWKPPQPQSSWNKTLSARELRHSCIQPKGQGSWAIFTEQSEDCLYLNVYSPRQPKASGPLPVMMFFYGGSWDGGSASFPLYWGGEDIALEEDVIIVTSNYRLNEFCCLASHSMKSLDPEGSTGNLAIKDQRAAMEWVQDHIAAFGGNPQHVTIWGESAGGGSVSVHMTNPRSWPYMHGAIIESGPVAVWSAQTFDAAEAKYVKLAQNAGCANESMSKLDISSSVPVLDCLRALNTSQLKEANHGLPGGIVQWGPTIDGVEILEDPQVSAQKGQIADVPMMLGSNRNEGTLFNAPPFHLKAEDAMEWCVNKYDKCFCDTVMPEYPPDEYRSPYWALTSSVGDAAMTCPSRRMSRWHTNTKSKAFLYYFDHELEVIKLFAPQLGVFHGSELAQVFHIPLVDRTADERALADMFVRYWTRFGVYGDPNGDYSGSDPVWPFYQNATDLNLVLDVPKATTNATNLKGTVCDFWDETPLPRWIAWGYPAKPTTDDC